MEVKSRRPEVAPLSSSYTADYNIPVSNGLGLNNRGDCRNESLDLQCWSREARLSVVVLIGLGYHGRP